MTTFIAKIFGFPHQDLEDKGARDDFSRFFFDAKSKEKAKMIRGILREATEEQQALLDRHRQRELAKTP